MEHGRIDAEALRYLLARIPLAGAEDEQPVYAVDVSVWPRCDAESSPLLKVSTTTHPATPPANPAWQDELTSS